MLQLNPSIPVAVVASQSSPVSGTAECVGWFDYGKEDDLMWLCIMDNTGEAWLVPNKDIRGIRNYSIGRTLHKAGDRGDVPPDNALRDKIDPKVQEGVELLKQLDRYFRDGVFG